MKVPFVTFKPLERELDKEIRSAFERVYERSWYIEGFEDKNFEESFSKYCDRKYCVGVGNGLDALFLSLKALNIKEGDEVIRDLGSLEEGMQAEAADRSGDVNGENTETDNAEEGV